MNNLNNNNFNKKNKNFYSGSSQKERIHLSKSYSKIKCSIIIVFNELGTRFYLNENT
jgi:hypothetical protein